MAISYAGGDRMGKARVGGTLIVCRTSKVNDDDFEELLEFLQKRATTTQRILAHSEQALSATQRSTMRDLFQEHKWRVALLTRSVFARGALTAISWFVSGLKAFGARDVAGALDHLAVPAEERAEVERTFAEMRAELHLG